MKILLDPGHGGKDTGATYEGQVLEKDIVLQSAIILGSMLSRNGHEVGISRGYDTFISLDKRCGIANNKNYDVFVSLHCNWWKEPDAQGTTVFHHEASQKGQALAESISHHVDQFEAIPNRYAKPSDSTIDKDRTPYMKVLDGTAMPAVLVEQGFLSNKYDRQVLTDKHELSNLLAFIKNGIVDWGSEYEQ
jgi:N-acetylmuramoyl-L-alanine amidase